MNNDAYENAKIYKQRMKFFHDKQIMRKSFTSSQKVFLFNSRLHLFLGKLCLNGLTPLLFTLFFHMEQLILRIQRMVSLLKLMVKD